MKAGEVLLNGELLTVRGHPPDTLHGNGIPGHGSLMTPWEDAQIKRMASNVDPEWLNQDRAPYGASIDRRSILQKALEARSDVPPHCFAVALNEDDAAAIERDARDQYRTPAQQIAFIVHSHYTKPAKPAAPAFDHVKHAYDAAVGRTRGVPVPPPAAPEEELEPGQLIPAYHVGDGSGDDMPFGKGCGKVGVLLSRRIGPGEQIRPGDVLTIHGTPIMEGGLMCGGCGQPIAPASWRTE